MTSKQAGRGWARIRTARGPLETERLLLADLAERVAGRASPFDPLAWVVVPSRSLRLHLLARVTRHFGRALIGLRCVTLHGLATEILDVGGQPAPGGFDLSALLARRHARDEAALRRALGHLVDGYGAIVATVRDLLDAGLEPEHVAALDELLATEGPAAASAQEVTRARCLVRVAGATAQSLREIGAAHRSEVLRRADELLRGADGPPPPAGLMILGFGDATGIATDLLATLLERWGATLYLDRAPDPTDLSRPDPGNLFTRRFRERLTAIASPEPPPAEPLAAGRVEPLAAIGPSAEVREVARRIGDLLAAGARPESIGLVARTLEGYRRPLRAELRRLGVPFSGLGARGPRRPDGRRLQALHDVLARGPRVAADRWLDALGVPPGRALAGAPLYDLRLALSALGAGRLGEVADLTMDELAPGELYRLPARLGFSEVEGQPADAATALLLRRRTLPTATLRGAVEAAATLLRRVERLRRSEPADRKLAAIDKLVRDDLGWQVDEPLTQALRAVFERLENELPAGLTMQLDELLWLLEKAFRDLGTDDLGGRGGGVQVLDVIESRGRTFDHLFVLGLNRGIFPRPVHEDPVLGDALRHVLAREGHGLLPDLPRKLSGHDEERYLFAQLVACSPRVTLSWQLTDDDNLELAPSPLVDRLRWSERFASDPLWRAPPVAGHYLDPAAPPGEAAAAADDTATEDLLTPREQAVRTALDGDRGALAEVLPVALAEAALRNGDSDHAGGPAAQERLARVRIAVLDELDPVLGSAQGEATRARLGPYYGLVGAAEGAADPRRAQPLFITTLERLAGCPWQAFLERVLRLEPPPDPLETLPGVDPLLIGDLVHRVLEQVAGRHLEEAPDGLNEARGSRPLPATWPEDEELDAIVRRQAIRVARRHGIGLAGFPRLLGLAVGRYLETARQLEWTAPMPVVGVEMEGAIELRDPRDEPQRVRFKADRVDRHEDGLAFTDYKTGRRGLPAKGRRPPGRDDLLRAVRSGRWLQAAAYALASGSGRDSGSYLFLHPEFQTEEARRVRAEGGDGELEETFRQVTTMLLGAWRDGTFFPRLVAPDRDAEPTRCTYCDVAEACLRGDSSSRMRLRDWAAADAAPAMQPAARAALEPSVERALRDVWWLAADRRPAAGKAKGRGRRR